jgi:hypothetical protein
MGPPSLSTLLVEVLEVLVGELPLSIRQVVSRVHQRQHSKIARSGVHRSVA